VCRSYEAAVSEAYRDTRGRQVQAKYIRRQGDAIILSRKDGEVVGNAAMVEYTEITAANITSFHFHGGTDYMSVMRKNLDNISVVFD
jgi:hypothetical protein